MFSGSNFVALPITSLSLSKYFLDKKLICICKNGIIQYLCVPLMKINGGTIRGVAQSG